MHVFDRYTYSTGKRIRRVHVAVLSGHISGTQATPENRFSLLMWCGNITKQSQKFKYYNNTPVEDGYTAKRVRRVHVFDGYTYSTGTRIRRVHVFDGYTYSTDTRIRGVHVFYGARIRPIHIFDGQRYSTGTRSGAIWAHLGYGYPGHASKQVLSADVVWEYY